MSKRYSIDDLEGMIDEAKSHRKKLAAAGLIDPFGHHVKLEAPKPAKEEKKKEPHTHDSYCLKCRKTVKSVTSEVKPTERGTHLAKGKCQTCGTSTAKLMSNQDGIKMLGDMATTGGTA